MNDPARAALPPEGAEEHGLDLFGKLKRMFSSESGESESVRDVIEELIEERFEEHPEDGAPIDPNERLLLANVLKLRDVTAADIMVPRADIVAVEVGTPRAEIVDIIAREGHSRLPIYRESLDDAMGMIHIKDLFLWQGPEETFDLSKLLRRLLFVAPSMEVLELLLEMRAKRAHMALVVDEYGGVDGLVTIEDLVEEIVGEIEDEHDRSAEPALLPNADGSFTADARVTIEALEQVLAPFADEDERDDIDTLGGLVIALAGRVPIRSELVNHRSGVEFEILQADPRRVHKLRVRRGDPGVVSDLSESGDLNNGPTDAKPVAEAAPESSKA